MSGADPIVVESVRRLFERHAPLALAQQADAATFALELWQATVDAGLVDALGEGGEPGDDGPGPLANAVAIVRGAGYHAVPLPLVEAMIAHRLIAESGTASDLAPVLLTVAAIPLGDARALPREFAVPWGRHAATVVTLEPHAGALQLATYAQSALRVTPGSDLAAQPMDRLEATHAPVWHPLRAGRTAADALAWAALLRAAQMVGAMERTFDLALDHANTRVQFGKAIGKFQMVQQMLAQHANEIAAATAAVDLAAERTDWTSLHFYAAVAKARASEAAAFVAECAHQVTAAMGYATEFPLHLFTRRLWSWRDEYGNERHWHALLGRRALQAGAAGLWPLLTDGPATTAAGIVDAVPAMELQP